MQRERQVRNEIVLKVVAGIEKKARAQADEKPIAQSWDCSQIEEEEEEEDCQKAGPDGGAMGQGCGTKKDGRKLLAGGSHAKGTRIGST